MKHFIRTFLPGALLALALCAPVRAMEADAVWGDVYCFGPSELTGEAEALGVMMTQVPDEAVARLCLGSRRILPGDVLTARQADALTLTPVEGAEGEAAIACLSITPDGLGPETVTTLKIGSGRNEAPTAEDSTFETYRNIPAQIPLSVNDPDGDALTVRVVKEPRRGTLTLGEDGTVTYTPEENKVGKDSFTYTVTDSAGNTSPEATVRIQIQKPHEKGAYGDMDGDPAQLSAVWLRENGIYTGKTVAGELLFCPDETLSRGEFVAMCVAMTKDTPQLLETGFIDGSELPLWLQPYVSAALKSGYLSGIPTENGLAMEADSPMRQGEAAVLLTRLLNLPQNDAETVMASEEGIPAWAAPSVAAASEAGLTELRDVEAPLTRRQGALLLYQAWNLAKSQESSLLAWAQES